MTINCKGQLIDLTTPKVMNFKRDPKVNDDQPMMISDGATFIDIGAYSSKPSAEFVSENEELGRIVPVVQPF
jgi:dihydropteroate synthase